MGKYFDILIRQRTEYDQNDQNDKSAPTSDPGTDFGRLGRFGRKSQQFCRPAFKALQRRCPEHVEPDRWQRAIEDGGRFLARWSEQAAALGWTARDLFGLHTPPVQPAPNYRRLSRYDQTGLIWLLGGRPVVALTDTTAAIKTATGAVTVYRRYNKPALGPVGDSLDDFDLRGRE